MHWMLEERLHELGLSQFAQKHCNFINIIIRIDKIYCKMVFECNHGCFPYSYQNTEMH